MCKPGRPDSKLCVVVTVDHHSCFLRERCLCESSAPSVHGHHCGMDPMFFDVCERVVALKHFPRVIMSLILLRLSKTLARLVTPCGKVQITVMKPPLCSEEQMQRAGQALSAFMVQQAALPTRRNRITPEHTSTPEGAEPLEEMTRS